MRSFDPLSLSDSFLLTVCDISFSSVPTDITKRILELWLLCWIFSFQKTFATYEFTEFAEEIEKMKYIIICFCPPLLHLSWDLFMNFLLKQVTLKKSHCCTNAKTGERPAVIDIELTPWRRVHREKTTVTKLIKEFPALYGNRRFMTCSSLLCSCGSDGRPTTNITERQMM